MSRQIGLFESFVDALVDRFARITLALYVDVRVEDAERAQAPGATIIAAHHFHFLFDALVLTRVAHQPAHFWAALDWADKRWQRAGMELLCRSARWPIILRVDDFTEARLRSGEGAYRLEEAQPLLREATRLALQLLRAGETMLIFPEAYTSVDIFPTPKSDGVEFLPFRPGFVKLAQLAERDGVTRVRIVPAGLRYERLSAPRRPRWRPALRPLWRLTLRLGEPRYIASHASAAEVDALVAEIERESQALSAPLVLVESDVTAATSEASAS